MPAPDRLPLALDVVLSAAMPVVTILGVCGAWRLCALVLAHLGG